MCKLSVSWQYFFKKVKKIAVFFIFWKIRGLPQNYFRVISAILFLIFAKGIRGNKFWNCGNKRGTKNFKGFFAELRQTAEIKTETAELACKNREIDFCKSRNSPCLKSGIAEITAFLKLSIWKSCGSNKQNSESCTKIVRKYAQIPRKNREIIRVFWRVSGLSTNPGIWNHYDDGLRE